MSFEKSRGHRGGVHFLPSQKVFDAAAVPTAARAARREVLDAKKMDILGLGKPGWNLSTTNPLQRFPDRPLQRTLSAFDAPKRSDYNFRTEWLDSKSRETYIPRTNKLHVSQRDFLGEAHRSHANLSRPPKQSTVEGIVHPSLAGKANWNVSTETLSAKARKQLAEADLVAARASRSAGYEPRETLQQREARLSEQQRAEKREKVQMAEAGITLPPPTIQYYHTTKEDFAEMTMQVPAKRVTTWSLGSI
ncbi:hypothetical protein T492DRAFT_1149123 [Pavlovales sp. CCMP2436]|nr:hypothetical protein T492DRAFT_1149123 [Pavlovales sp. CCMP2436]|mmetsp:Transcript_1815/g.4668  ORF Transcript_1815/g.4668 Transcript_1815/m.4668 type:complete len:249 (-) Transcript_1815:166-912(-)